MVYRWDSQTGQLISSFQGNELGVYSLAFSPDGRRLAVGGGEWWIPIFSYVGIWTIEDDFEFELSNT